MDDIIKTLSYSHYLCLKQMDEDKFLTNEELNKLNGKLPFMRYDYLHKLVMKKLGFDYESKSLVPKFKVIEKSALSEFTYHNTIVENKIAQKIKEYYGDEAYVLYGFVISFCNLFGACSAAQHFLNIQRENIEKGEKMDKVKKFRFERERKRIFKYFKELIWIFDNPDYLLKFYEPKFVEQINEINQFISDKPISLDFLEEVHLLMSNIIQNIAPISVFRNYERAIELVRELESIQPGIAHWNKYEKFCIKVLNYLFVPTFRKVYTQARTSDGYERRDAIMPNYSDVRFWNDIKDEFNSKNIVFEFKNLSKGYSKEALNQLRIYLSKPTIGKFGFLFIRDSKEINSLLKAQKDAYEQNQILILILNDKLLEKLIMAKAYFGSCEDIIANQKIKFEINY